MLALLKNLSFAQLFAAQSVALLGTGLLTIALALLAFDLAGENAGLVLGTALMIKMVAYVGLSPVMQALTANMPRKTVLISADLIRAVIALGLPFVDAVWQVYVLIFALQTASATFTPAIQATIPDIVPDEADYTRALSLSRLAYEIENIASPALAGLLLGIISFHGLFFGTVLGFCASAALVGVCAIPETNVARQRPFIERLGRGWHIYKATPRLRGLFALNLTVAATGAFAIVNTVVLLDGQGQEVAKAMAAFGLGAISVAIVVPKAVDRCGDRRIMLGASALAPAVLIALVAILQSDTPPIHLVWAVWFVFGASGASIMTPSARLLRRSAHTEDRPAIFTAQFAASHACWLVAYPLAGWTGAALGLQASAIALTIMAALGAILAFRIWPAETSEPIPHSHAELPHDHPHVRQSGAHHSHPIIIDDMHPTWPRTG